MISEKYIKAVSEKNIEKVRFFISQSVLLDTTGKEAEELIAYASNYIDVFENNEATMSLPEIDNEAAWNKDVLFDVQELLRQNFSREKYEYYLRMAKVVLTSDNSPRTETKEEPDISSVLKTEFVKTKSHTDDTKCTEEDNSLLSAGNKDYHHISKVVGVAAIVAVVIIIIWLLIR